MWGGPLGRFCLGQEIPTLLQPNPPFHQTDWPLATKFKINTLDSTLGQNNPLRTPNPRQPFHQTDWPSAVRAALRIRDNVETSGAPQLPAYQVPIFRQSDWPNPSLVRNIFSESYGLNLSLSVTAAVAAQFRAPVYTIIPAPRKAIVDDFVNMDSLLHPPAPVLPLTTFSTYDWPRLDWQKIDKVINLGLLNNVDLRPIERPERLRRIGSKERILGAVALGVDRSRRDCRQPPFNLNERLLEVG